MRTSRLCEQWWRGGVDFAYDGPGLNLTIATDEEVFSKDEVVRRKVGDRIVFNRNDGVGEGNPDIITHLSDLQAIKIISAFHNYDPVAILLKVRDDITAIPWLEYKAISPAITGQGVSPPATKDDIAATAAFQLITASFAIDCIGAAAAIQKVSTTTTQQLITPTAAFQNVPTAAAIQRVRAAIALQQIPAAIACNLVPAGAA